MKRIFKYLIPVDANEFELDLPLDAEVLTFQSQHEDFYIWAIVEDKEEKIVPRYFRLVGTRRPLITGKYKLKGYIGTAQIGNGGLVFHLFEIYYID